MSNNTDTNLSFEVEKLIKFFDANSIDYSRFDFEKKNAYYNYEPYMNIPNQHDTQKWLETVRNIYKMEKDGHGRASSIRQATSGWKVTETFDFLNWLRFYEQGNHLKYKVAQLWYENGTPGYFLKINPDKEKESPSVSGKDIDYAKEESTINADKRQVIERQRNKIIGRLDSAEKLMRSPDGQVLAGHELEALMEAIYQLKKKIQLVNKISTSTRTYEDMIVREANILHRHGFVKAAEFLHSTAQANNPPPSGTGKSGDIDTLPSVTPPDSPIAPFNPGAPGGFPSMGPGMPQNAPADTGAPKVGPNDSSPTNLNGIDPNPQPTAISGTQTPLPTSNESTAPIGIQNFLANMETSNVTTKSDSESTDDLEVRDSDLEVEDDFMVSEAQSLQPSTQPLATKKDIKPLAKPSIENPLEVTEDDSKAPIKGNSAQSAGVDQKINDLFKSISIDEIINEIDLVAGIFRQREIPNRISRIDLMLKGKGLSAYFPTIGEMLQKSLDANNYCSTRIEEVLSKIRGAIGSDTININEKEDGSPDAAGLKNKLRQDQDKDRQRKLQRKEQENAEFDSGIGKQNAPDIEVNEDLGGQPAPSEKPIATPAGPKLPVPAKPVA